MLPRIGSSKFVSHWILLTLAASIIAALDGGWLWQWAALEPAKVWHGEVWRLATWPLIEGGPLALVFTCLAIYKFGGELAVVWGDQRLWRFARRVVLAASVVTCVLAALTGGGHLHRLGGCAVADALVIAWARQFPQRGLTLYGLVTLRGRDLVTVTVGVAVLFALYFGPIATAPELVACLAAAAYPRGLL